MRRRGGVLLAALVACAVGLVWVSGAFASGAGSVYVAASGGNDGNLCTSSSACATISQALTQAGDDGYSSPTVYVSGTINEDNITISGSQFSGTVTIAQNPAQGAAQADVKAVYADGQPVFQVELGAAAQFTGITIDGIHTADGGAINDNSSHSVTATDVTFQGSSTVFGGAIFVQGGGAVTATDDVFDHVGSGDGGGAIYEYSGGPLTVSGSTFDYNATNGGDGGAIELDDSAATTITDSTFEENVSDDNGGAIANDGLGTLTIGGSTFYRNTAGVSSNSNTYGGALYLGTSSGLLNLYTSTFDGNTANGDGFLGSPNASAFGNTIYAVTGAPHPEFAGDLFYGSCALNNDAPVIDAYNFASDSSCLPGADSSDVISASTGDLYWNDPGTNPTAPLTPPADVPGAANPAAATVPGGATANSVQLCSITDADGVTGSGPCNAGASQSTVARPSLYVANPGTNSGSCTSGAPCATITYALSSQNQYSDPTVYVSGDVSGLGIDITEDTAITAWPSGPDSGSSLDGGNSTSNGMLLISDGTVTISGLTLQNAGGGAIWDTDSEGLVTLSNDTFQHDGNSYTHEGGAVANAGSGTLDVSNDTFTGDSASGSPGAGGAIFIDGGGIVNVTASAFSQGSAVYGGSIAVEGGTGGTVHISDGSSFTDDSASSAGGAIASTIGSGSGATVTIDDSSFSSDTSIYGSAIINGYANSSPANLTVSNSVFYANGSPITGGVATSSSEAYGGAIENGYSSGGHGIATITGSTFYEDGAYDYGGAIDNGNGGTGSLTLLDSTLADDAVGGGSELINNDTASGVTVAGDIFDGTCTEGAAPGFGSNVTDDGYNVSTDSTCTNSGTGDVTATSESALNLGTPGSGNSETFKPKFSSPAAGIIPASAEAGSPSISICGFADMLGNSGPTATGACNAGAIQAYSVVAPTGTVATPTATAAVGQATVSWSTPSLNASGGGVNYFIVTPYNTTTQQAGTPQDTTSAVNSLLITGLTDGDSYTFTVKIYNSAGTGSASTASSAVTIQSPASTTTTTTPTTTSTPTTTTTPSTTTTTPVTSTPPSTTTSTASTAGNQKLTLTSPNAKICMAASKKAMVKLRSAAIPKSKAAKTTFVSAVFSLAGKQSTTVKHLPASVSFKLTGLKKGKYTVKVIVTLHEKVGKKTDTVKKTVDASVSVC